MYTSCLACHSPLPPGAVLPELPIGGRIAFAPQTGRVWAVCEVCGEWNLFPLETRWEVVRTLDERFDHAVNRVSNDAIAMASLEDHDLIRIGPDQEDQLHNWRYAAPAVDGRVAHRVKRWTLSQARWAAPIGLAAIAGMTLGFGPAMAAVVLSYVAIVIASSAFNPVVARVPLGPTKWVDVRLHDLGEVRLVPDPVEDCWSFRIPTHPDVPGPECMHALRLLLPMMNRNLDRTRLLERALRYIKKKGGTTESVFLAAARRRGRTRTARVWKLEPHLRVALEILAHQEAEEASLRGELAVLQRAWEEAEELAAIQDALLLPPGVVTRFTAMKHSGVTAGPSGSS